MPPSASENHADRLNHPTRKGPAAETRGGAVPQVRDRPRALRACASIACPFLIANARAPQPSRAAVPWQTTPPSILRSEVAYRRCGPLAVFRAYAPLAMTGRAARQLGRRTNLALHHELLPQLVLIRSRFPIHDKNFV